MKHIVVIGNGAWGTALALVAHTAGHHVTVWSVDEASINACITARENLVFLPGITLPADMHFTTDIHILTRADVVLSVIPAQVTPQFWQSHIHLINPHVPVIIASKGLPANPSPQNFVLTQVLSHALHDDQLAVLTGPNFADEVALGLPAITGIAASTKARAEELGRLLSTKNFRPYASDDRIGMQVCAALKNVIAIACGIADGAELGRNAQAALLTRGLAEMMHFGLHLGAKPETFMGVAGVGDLTLTAMSPKSRNYRLGALLGQGIPYTQALDKLRSTVEGAATAQVVIESYPDLVEFMPITEAVYRLMMGHSTVDLEMESLMRRPLR